MALLDQKAVMWIAAVIAAYVIYRLMFSSKEPALSRYESEVEEILTSDKYKVKGRFEE